MSRLFTVQPRALPTIAAALLLAVAAPGTAAAAVATSSTGRVVVFTHELARTTVYDHPADCSSLPFAAHVLINLTDHRIRIHAGPSCQAPLVAVQPGYGTHAPPAGSFSVLADTDG